MADFTAPSFSLSLDFEEEDEEIQEEPPFRNPPPANEDEGLDSDETLDPDQEEEEEEPLARPSLKRLRRGPPPPPPPSSADGINGSNDLDDDDIEDFSQEEECWRPDQSASLQSRASCSSSKFSLAGHGFLSSQSANKSKTPKITPTSNALNSTTFAASTNKSSFSRSTVSPLRKIHLLDSDSDDPSPNRRRAKDCKEVDASKPGTQHMQFSLESDRKTFQFNFNPKGNTSVATPTLDEFCEEYFTSAKYHHQVGHHKENDRSLNSSRVFDPDDLVNDVEMLDHNWDPSHPQPPAYKYFYHDNVKIRRLVRERLPFFVPIGEVNGKASQQHLQVENLDYMDQFGPTKGPSQARGAREKGTGGSSRARGKRSSASVEEASDATGSWVNPRCNASIPKDASKRRVSAVGSGSGHWFTSENGRKVYIAQDGKELTGRVAYRQYRKDTGTGFPKRKKKAAAAKRKKK